MAVLTTKRSMLLDLDGTVVDTHELIFQCYDRTMREHYRCEGSRQILAQCTGMHLSEIFLATLRHFGITGSEELMTVAISTYRSHLRANEASVTTFAGMRETLIELERRGWGLAIVTTKPRDSALRHLESQGLLRFFQTVVAGDQCANLKPHPEPFLRALAALGVDADEAVGVGDSEHDIRAARAAGMATVAACWGALNRANLLAAQPDVVAEQPSELVSLAF